MFPTHRIILKRLPRPFLRRIRLCLYLAPLLAALACYEPDPIQSAVLSPDGRFLAVITAQHELGVLDLVRMDPIRIFTRQAGTGMAWSPDSQRLAYVEESENVPSSLIVADVITGKAERLLHDGDWKGWPAFLSDGRVAFLSDREADDVNVWTIEMKGRRLARSIDRPNDVSRLWGAPAGDALAFQTMEAGSAALLLWRAADGHQVRLITENSNGSAGELTLAFTPDGRHVAIGAQRQGQAELSWVDTATGTVQDRISLPRPALDLAVTGQGRVAVGQGTSVALWRPHAAWYQRTLTDSTWYGTNQKVLGAYGENGLVTALNGNVTLVADDADRLAAGRMQPRRLEDLLALSWGLASAGNVAPARQLLADVQARANRDTREDYLVAMAWAELERLEGRWRAADPWLGRAVRAAAPGGPEEEAAWLERLALAAYDAKDRPLAYWVLEKMPAGLDRTALASWTKHLMDNPAGKGVATWIQVGGALRTGEAAEAARLVNRLVSADEPTTLTTRGISLILAGDFEPLGEVGNMGQDRLEKLMAQPEFQMALLGVLRRRLPGGPDFSELNLLLLGQWVRQGDFSSARELVRDSLGGSAEAITEYQEVLRRFLVLEETDRWMQRTVTEVLLAKDIAQTLNERLTTPLERLTLRLAQVKKALIDGEGTKAQAWLTDAQALEAQVAATDGAEGVFEQAQSMWLTLLFKTKVAERNRQWAAAIQSYQAAERLMRATPGSWEVSPFEVAFMNELLRTGAAQDPDLLRTYLEILRGAGDPLVNPSNVPETLDVGLSNLATLRRVVPDTWFAPYISYTMGLYRALGRQSWRSIYDLREAQRQQPGPALLQRALLEEAAARDTLGQHALAARLYQRLYRMEAPPAQRAAAIQAAIQAEAACGKIVSPEKRLREILENDPLPQPWKEWLWIQQGGEDAKHSALE